MNRNKKNWAFSIVVFLYIKIDFYRSPRNTFVVRRSALLPVCVLLLLLFISVFFLFSVPSHYIHFCTHSLARLRRVAVSFHLNELGSAVLPVCVCVCEVNSFLQCVRIRPTIRLVIFFRFAHGSLLLFVGTRLVDGCFVWFGCSEQRAMWTSDGELGARQVS